MPLPENVKLLTLQAVSPHQILVRFEHVFAVGEVPPPRALLAMSLAAI
jgi:hypothetical protein